jgi:hypothetical protein
VKHFAAIILSALAILIGVASACALAGCVRASCPKPAPRPRLTAAEWKALQPQPCGAGGKALPAWKWSEPFYDPNPPVCGSGGKACG